MKVILWSVGIFLFVVALAAGYDLLTSGKLLHDECTGKVKGRSLQIDQNIILIVEDEDGGECSVTRHRLELHKCLQGSRYPDCAGVR